MVTTATAVRQSLRLAVFLGILLAPTPSSPADSSAVDPPSDDERPRIGLALSGGGARGCAHVGVLRVLEEMNVPVDYVAGTSMGAIVGGLYASGLSAARIEEILTTMDWSSIADDEQPRRDRAYRRKEDDQRYVMNLEIGLRGFVLPSGLRSGQRFTFELRRHTLPVTGVDDFRNLPIPFKAVATDIETGEKVVLDSGNLATAMRASMSIPGVFTPTEVDGRVLVDGGLVSNLPVEVVREMGADIVIAVDIGTQLQTGKKLRSLFDITSQSMTISSSRDVAALLTERDLLLTPDLAGRGTLAFGDVAEIICEGESEARRRTAELAPYALSAQEYARHLEGRQPPPARPDLLTAIEIRGLERVDGRIVRRVIRSEIGQPLDLETLRRDLGRIFGLGDFELVDHELSPEVDGWRLVVRVTEKKGGPFFLRSALNVDADGDQNIFTSILLNLTALRVNALGGEWRNDLKIGSEQILESEFYQPLDFGGRWFVAPRVLQRRDIVTIFSEDRPFAEFEQLSSLAALDLGLSLGTYGEIRLGAFRERREQTLESGPRIAKIEDEIDLGGWAASLSIDRLDSIYFPRSGQLVVGSVVAARPSFGSDDSFEVAGASYVAVKSAGRHTFLSWIELSSGLKDDQPPYAQFGGGGLFSFSGYQPGELSGAAVGVFRPTYLYRLGTLSPILGKGIYVGGWLEAGNYWPSRDDVRLDDLRYAATVTLGAETVIGPAYLAIGFAEHGRRQFYLSIGASF